MVAAVERGAVLSVEHPLTAVLLEVEFLQDHARLARNSFNIELLVEACVGEQFQDLAEVLRQERCAPLDEARTGRGIALLDVVLAPLLDLFGRQRSSRATKGCM